MTAGTGESNGEKDTREELPANHVTRTYRNALLYMLPEDRKESSDPCKLSLADVLAARVLAARKMGLKATDPRKIARARELKVYKNAVAERVLELCRYSTYESLRHAGKIHEHAERQKTDKTIRLSVPAVSKALGYQTNLSQSSFNLVVAGVKNYRRQEKKLADTRAFFKQHPRKFQEFLLFGRSPFTENCLAKKWRIKRTYSRNFLGGVRVRLDKYLPAEIQLGASFPVITAEQFKKASQLVLEEIETSIQERLSRGEKVDRARAFRNKVRLLERHADKVVNFLYQPLVLKGFEQPFTTGWQSLKKRAGELVNPSSTGKGGQKTRKILPGRATRYHSALRAVLIRTPAAAVLEEPEKSPLAVTFQGKGVEFANILELLTADRCLSRAFHGKKYSEHQEVIKQALPAIEEMEEKVKQTSDNQLKKTLKKQLQELEGVLASRLPPLPVLLVMGAKHVIYRPGNAEVNSRLLRENGVLPLVIPGCRVKKDKKEQQRKQKITVFLPAPRKVREALQDGAVLDVLRIHPPVGPTKKIIVDMILSGPASAFTATRHLEKIKLVKGTASREVLGLDINAPGPHVVAFSNQDPLSQDSPLPLSLLATCRHFAELKDAKKALHRGRDRLVKKGVTGAKLARLDLDLALLGRKQERLTRAVANRSRVTTGQELVRTGAKVLAIEQLSLDAKGTRGALAEAILSLPDDPAVTSGAVTSVNHYWEQQSSSHRVVIDSHDPRGSSSYHMDCPSLVNGQEGKLPRIKRSSGKYHFAPCQACGQLLNTHVLAARYLEKLSKDKLNHAASAIAVP